MRGRPAVAMFTLVLVSIVTACTSGTESAQPGKRATAAATSKAPPNGQAANSQAANGQAPNGRAPGEPRCHPASPVTLWNSFLPQVRGTGHGATLWGLLMFPHPLPAQVGDQEKIVWRMTGTGLPLTLAAIGPNGQRHPLAWGPAAHLPGSTWDKPGDEWGAGYVFTAPGCWDLRAVRGKASADVWLRVVSR